MCLQFIYTLGTQPLRVGFYDDEIITGNETFWLVMEVAIDVWFLIDVGLNFRTGYWDEQTKLVIMDCKVCVCAPACPCRCTTVSMPTHTLAITHQPMHVPPPISCRQFLQLALPWPSAVISFVIN